LIGDRGQLSIALRGGDGRAGDGEAVEADAAEMISRRVGRDSDEGQTQKSAKYEV
jgi:hypothetical protein